MDYEFLKYCEASGRAITCGIICLLVVYAKALRETTKPLTQSSGVLAEIGTRDKSKALPTELTAVNMKCYHLNL
jgi:hypothetical protein